VRRIRGTAAALVVPTLPAVPRVRKEDAMNEPGPWQKLAEHSNPLIATAPEMLDFIETYVAECPMCHAGVECEDTYCSQARALIRKAKGLQP
jgi:hypothetical protein